MRTAAKFVVQPRSRVRDARITIENRLPGWLAPWPSGGAHNPPGYGRETRHLRGARPGARAHAGSSQTRTGDTTMTQPSQPLSSNTSASDVDAPYTWGRRPETYLAPREIVRLTIFRSRLADRAELHLRQVAAND